MGLCQKSQQMINIKKKNSPVYLFPIFTYISVGDHISRQIVKDKKMITFFDRIAPGRVR